MSAWAWLSDATYMWGSWGLVGVMAVMLRRSPARRDRFSPG
jgi:hypothetical protein